MGSSQKTAIDSSLLAVVALFLTLSVAIINPIYSIPVGILFLIPFMAKITLSVRPQSIFYGCLFVMIVLEGDYPEYEAIVEKIYEPFLTQQYIPVVSPYEILGMMTLAWIFLRDFHKESNFVRRAFWTVALFSGLHFTIGVIQMMVGLGSGGRLQVAFWQMKSFMVFPIWAMFGFLVVREPKDATRLLSTVLAAVALKTAYNCEVLLLGMGGTRGTREYISSHVGSFFMAISIIVALIRLSFLEVPKKTKWFYWVFVVLAVFIWFVNDRRASLMGSALSAIFAGIIVFPFAKKETIRKIVRWALSIGLVIGLTWELPSPTPGGIIKGITTHGNRMNENEPDYRDIENYNLFTGISQHPFGRGYGFPFERYMEMPDIFDLAEILSWVPHNSMLMIWLFGGPQNAASLAVLFIMSIAVSVRLFRESRDKRERILGIVTFMMMVQWLIYVWADMAWSFVSTISAPGALVGSTAGLLARLRRSPVPESAELTTVKS